MAKKGKAPPDVESLRKAVDRFTKQADRGAALVAASWVDDALESCIRANLRDNKELADEFKADGFIAKSSIKSQLPAVIEEKLKSTQAK